MPRAALPDQPLAEQARTRRWWLRAARRKPAIVVCFLGQPLIVAVSWSIWHPGYWLKLIGVVVLQGPVRQTFRHLRWKQARALERADEDAERTGRRRPVAVPLTEAPPITFQWASPAGRAIMLRAAILAGFTAAALGVVSIMIVVPPSDAGTSGAPFYFVVAGVLFVGFPIWLWISNYRATLGSIHRVLAGSGERALVEVLGIEPDTQHWVLRRQDDGSRIAVKLLGGNELLVAGHELPAHGLIRTSAKEKHRPLLALAAPGGTLWALHRGAVEPGSAGSAQPETARPDAPQPGSAPAGAPAVVAAQPNAINR
jgi:hypothetical protein